VAQDLLARPGLLRLRCPEAARPERTQPRRPAQQPWPRINQGRFSLGMAQVCGRVVAVAETASSAPNALPIAAASQKRHNPQDSAASFPFSQQALSPDTTALRPLNCGETEFRLLAAGYLQTLSDPNQRRGLMTTQLQVV